MTGKRPRIGVIGSTNMDLTTTVARMPVWGETVLAKHFETSFGGKGANQAVAAATAWLAPLPPKLVSKCLARTVSPQTGMRATVVVRSILVEPMTPIRGRFPVTPLLPEMLDVILRPSPAPQALSSADCRQMLTPPSTA